MKKDVMSATSSTRRELLAATVAAGAASLLSAKLSLAAEDASIRPFHISVPEEQLVDLRRRIAATRWPEKDGDGRVARRAARDDREARPLLGERA